MKGSEARKRIYKSLCASFLAFVMILTNVLGAVEVQAAAVKEPTVNPVFYDATTISGGNLAKAKVNKQTVIATVHVILKGEDGNVKATLSDNPTSGTTWSVNLPEGVKVAKGDTVTVYQQIGENKSPEVTKTSQQPKADLNKDKLKMPIGEIWIEQISSNIVNEDEQAEAVEMFNNANTAIAGDIKSVKFSIDTAAHAYYEVTYTDGSTSGKIEATNLQIKQVKEHSRGATLGSITIVDNVIKGQLSGEGPFDGIKVQILLKLSDAVKDSYCDGGKCLVDKDTSKPVDATVDGKTGEFTYTIPNPDLKLDQKVGVTVKEPHKFKSCSQTPVIAPIPEKTEVKDPRKLTAKDKEAIDAAIRKAYTVNGVSKLPNGTGDWDGVPAVIQIDDSGNVKIFSGNDVAGTWDENYKFVPEKNEDGSYKVVEGAQPKITIPAKDLVKNIKPEAPAVALSKDKKNITITPNLKVDTDANSISVSYTGKDGSTKTTTATKGDSGWTIEGEGSVDQNGVITLPKDKVKGDTTVTATVKDKGGIAEGDTDPLTSDPGTLTVEETKADKVEALGGLDPKDIKKWVGDDVNWKDGIKAKDSTKETEVNKLLEGATFEDATDTARKTDSAGTRPGKIKVKFDDNSELVVDNQTLYVSNHVTNKDAQNLPDDALEVEFQLGEGTKVNNVGSGAIEGKKDTPTLYQKYKVKPNTNLKDYKLPTINQSVVDSIKLSAQEGYVEPAWNTENFTATKTNKIFTATATKAYNVTFEANGGDGNMAGAQVKENGTYKLPDNAFTPPNENQEFAGWLVNGATTVTKPGTDITITKDTVIKASWKPIEFKAKFLPGEGATGSMEEKTVTKGSEFELPTPTFTAPKDKVFAGWKVPGEAKVKKAGDKIGISGDVTLTATWKDIEYKVTFNGTEGTGTMPEKLVKKGEEYTLPDNGFEAPKDKVFDGWMVGTDKKSAGDTITVNGDTEVKAVWKDIEYKVTFNGTEGTGT
ncbi:InlB B-repeat-containing protein, partial [Aedoeadaptatus coxii]|uniref:InlB B-repeat-containing protein n=1 Tax=Aedoeadaptatus coxii TaxID=755172 RepID=UPI002AD40475